ILAQGEECSGFHERLLAQDRRAGRSWRSGGLDRKTYKGCSASRRWTRRRGGASRHTPRSWRTTAVVVAVLAAGRQPVLGDPRRRGPRQLLDDLPEPRHLERRQLLRRVVAQPGQVDLRTGGRDDEGLDLLLGQPRGDSDDRRSEEHTSELQSQST